ncbi:MAG: hypothetical protein WA133_13600 [Syntrophales bacterium]
MMLPPDYPGLIVGSFTALINLPVRNGPPQLTDRTIITLKTTGV